MLLFTDYILHINNSYVFVHRLCFETSLVAKVNKANKLRDQALSRATSQSSQQTHTQLTAIKLNCITLLSLLPVSNHEGAD